MGSPEQNAVIDAGVWRTIAGEANTGNPLKGSSERMARKRYQRGQLFQKGKREKVWVARWREDVIRPDGSRYRLRRSETLGTLKDFRRVASLNAHWNSDSRKKR